MLTDNDTDSAVCPQREFAAAARRRRVARARRPRRSRPAPGLLGNLYARIIADLPLHKVTEYRDIQSKRDFIQSVGMQRERSLAARRPRR
ncbi:unnamed protein product, partial [Brenthis ino]